MLIDNVFGSRRTRRHSQVSNGRVRAVTAARGGAKERYIKLPIIDFVGGLLRRAVVLAAVI
jgi:hypothetical protein